MSDIYEQHDKAFSGVTAYVLLENGAKVGTIAFKYPRDGAGRVWCYFHILGSEMVRGYAGGFGYDKQSAAASVAAKHMKANGRRNPESEEGAAIAARIAKIRALNLDKNYSWIMALERAGFGIMQAV